MKQKNNILKYFFLAVFFGLFFNVPFSHGAINGQINYQGKLTNASGVAVADGNYNIIFSIYDADSGGSCVWTARGTCGTPTARSVAVLNGIFSIMLGDTGAGDTALTGLTFNVPYYLGVKVGADAEMTPRKSIGASGYSFNSSLLNGLTSAISGADAHILATDTSGNVTVTGTIAGSNLSGTNTGDQPLIAGTTAGQLPFWNGTEWTYSETSELFWDDTNKRLGVGTATSNHTLDVNGNIGLAVSSYLNFGSTDGETGYGLRDNTGTLQFKNSGGTWVSLGSGGTTTFLALTDTPSSYNTGRILFETSSGISDNTNLFWDNTNQRLGIGTTTPDANLSISSASGSQFINLHDSTNSDSVGIYSGSGTPEGTVSAQIGSIYSDNASGRIYKKSSGDDTNIGWEEFTNTSSTAHMAKMTRDVAQSIPSGTWTKINFDTEEFDTGDIADVSTGRFTIKKAGKYLISASWYSSGNLDTGEMMGVSIVINGNDASVSRNYSANTNGYPTVVVSDSFDLSENDYVEMRIDQNEGASQNTSITAATKPRMSVVQLDDANGGESLFTDSGDATYLTSTTDDLILGSNTNTNAPFYLDVSLNSLRLGSGATTDASLNLYASDGDTGSISYTTNDSFYFDGGNIGIGTTSPTAYLNIKAGTTTAGSAPLKFTSGTNLTTAEAGAIEYDGNQLFFSPSTTRNILAQVSGATALTAGSIPFATTSGYFTQDNANLFWDNTNKRLGIGTTSPTVNLHIKGSGTSESIKVENIDSARTANVSAINSNGDQIMIQAGGPDFVLGASGYLATSNIDLILASNSGVSTGGTNNIYIAPGGYNVSNKFVAFTYDKKVGIGTLTPTANLQVAQDTGGTGTVTITGNTTCTGTGTQFTNTFKVGNSIIITATGETRAITAITSDTVMTIASATNTAGSAYTLAGGTRFSVLGNGNVGIGTTTPSNLLTVFSSTDNARVLVNSTLNTGQSGVVAISDSATVGMYAYGSLFGVSSLADSALLFSDANASAGLMLDAEAAAPIRFSTNGYANERMRIASDGKVGIGTTSPGYLLTVNGQPGANGYTAFTNYSDARLKENIAVLGDGYLDRIMQLKPSTFNYNKLTGYNEDTRQRKITGFIAQELQEVFPSMVGHTNINGTDYLDTNLSALPIYLIKGMQEQQGQIIGISQNVSELSSVNQDLILKTDENISTVSELQDLVSENLEKIINQVDLQNQSLESLQAQTNDHGIKIKSIEDMLVILQNKMDDFQEINNQELILAQIDLNRTDIDYIKMILGLDGSGNPGDIKMGGQLEAQGIVAGAFGVKITDEKNRTIGTVTIKAGDKSASVETELVNENSKIFVTPDQPVGIGVSLIKNGEGFEIETNIPTEKDLKIDWWIIEEQ